MSSETQRSVTIEDDVSFDATAGVIGGIVGGVAMGALVVVMNAAVLAVAIPSLYTLAPPANLQLGFLVQVFHGAALGLAFAGLVGTLSVDSPAKVVAAGLGWGVVTWLVLAALVMPLWLGAVGSPASPPFPNFALPSLLWHAVYGAVLGGVFAVVHDRF
ncbi:histidine kinase [Halobacteria archaeon HArc-gm2]|nr:histidine kinase [Halobacteria archaeon HArc-gm2]